MAQIPVVARAAIALTEAVRRAVADTRDHTILADFLFLERWEQAPIPGAAAAMRINQIRRANPGLAAEVRAEVRQGRPLTAEEREALAQLAARPHPRRTPPPRRMQPPLATASP